MDALYFFCVQHFESRKVEKKDEQVGGDLGVSAGFLEERRLTTVFLLTILQAPQTTY